MINECIHHQPTNSSDCSYRVASEKYQVQALHGSLATHKRNEEPIHIYLDTLCLCDGQDWEIGFMNGLYKSNVIVIMLSEAGLERTLKAHELADNQFVEVPTGGPLQQFVHS
jgi:hypothetical protein